MRCGNCGRKLTDAAIAMGYCPSCGTHIAMPGQEPQPSLAMPRGTTIVEQRMPEAPALPDPQAMPTLYPGSRTPSGYPSSQTPSGYPSSRTPSGYPSSRTPSGYPPYPAQAPTPSGQIGGDPSGRTPSGYPPPATPSYPTGRAPSGYADGSPRPLPAVIDSAGPPVLVVERRQGNTGVLILLILLIAVLAAGAGTLFAAGTQGKGPFAVIQVQASPTLANTPTATIVPTASPRPTNTPRPTATPVPSPTPTPTPAIPTPTTGFKSFTSPDTAFGLNYPTAWTASSTIQGSTTNFSFTSVDGSEYLSLVEYSSSISPSDISGYLQQFVANTPGSSGFRTTLDASPKQVGPNSWTSAQAVYTLSGNQQNIIGYAINHGQNGYLLFYTAPAGNFNTQPNSNFDVMVNSFTFLH